MKFHLLALAIVSLPIQAQVYEGCEVPAQSFKRTITLDGSAGQTFEDFKSELLPGDKIILKGKHERIYLNERMSPLFAQGEHWIQIEGQGAQVGSIDLRGMKRIELKNLLIESSISKTLVLISAKSSQIVLRDSIIRGGKDSSNWGVEEWLGAPTGIRSDNANCVSVTNNLLINLRHGISASTRAQVSSESSVKALIHNNEIRNLSGDFFRPLGSDITISKNRAYDGYLSSADGDFNHDDFIQGFAYPLGIEFSNVKIVDNYFQATTDPNRKFNADYQGISVFDGTYSNFLIRGNAVLGSAYHGISMYGGKNGVIENNTVLSINGEKKFRIYVTRMKGKSDYAPSENVLVRNNIANVIPLDKLNSGVTYDNNAVFLSELGPQHFVLFDMSRAAFDLHLKSSSPLAGMNLGSFGVQQKSALPIYPGCEVPSSSFKRKIVLDAAAGDYLNDFFYSGKAQPGDHIIVKGHQESFNTSKYSRPDLVSNPSWIKIESQGATFSKFDIRDLNRIQVSGLEVYQPKKGNVLNVASASNIVISESRFESDPSLSNYFGGRIDSSKCVSLSKSHFSGVRTGINVFSRASESSADYQMQVILKGLSFGEIERSSIGVNAGSVIVED